MHVDLAGGGWPPLLDRYADRRVSSALQPLLEPGREPNDARTSRNDLDVRTTIGPMSSHGEMSESTICRHVNAEGQLRLCGDVRLLVDAVLPRSSREDTGTGCQHPLTQALRGEHVVRVRGIEASECCFGDGVPESGVGLDPGTAVTVRETRVC